MRKYWRNGFKLTNAAAVALPAKRLEEKAAVLSIFDVNDDKR
jgi:hypothetical protein